MSQNPIKWLKTIQKVKDKWSLLIWLYLFRDLEFTGGKISYLWGFFSITLNKLKSAVTNYSKCMDHVAVNVSRALERMGVETSQLALARCVMRGVLGRQRSRGRTVEKWRVKTKFCSTYKVHCYGWTIRHFSFPFGSGHLYTICKLSVLNNRIIVSQIEEISVK